MCKKLQSRPKFQYAGDYKFLLQINFTQTVIGLRNNVKVVIFFPTIQVFQNQAVYLDGAIQIRER